MQHSYQTKRSGTNVQLLPGNQVAINVPVPVQHTVDSVLVQPRPRYDVGLAEDTVERAQ